MFELSI